MTTYHRGTSLGSTSDNSAYPSTSPSYSHMSTSRGSGVDIMLDVGEFCTGCAQTSRRVTLDGRLQTCPRHAANGTRHATTAPRHATSRRSLDHLADQLKKYNTRILPDPAQLPPQSSLSSVTHATLGHAPRQQQQQQQQQARRGQQELYRQRSLSMKQAQYQQRLRDQRDRLQSDSTMSANQSFTSGQVNTTANLSSYPNSNPANSQHRTYNPQFEGDYELVSNLSQPTNSVETSGPLSREPSVGRSSLSARQQNPSQEQSRETNRQVSREQTRAVDNPVYNGYNGVLGELNSRFNSTTAAAPSSRHVAPSSASTVTSSGVTHVSNGHSSRHASQRSLESGRVPAMDYTDNAGLGDNDQPKPHSTSTADVRCRAFTTSDNRHKRFSGEFPLTPANRAPSQPALSSSRPMDQANHVSTTLHCNPPNVRHAQSISGLNNPASREHDQHRVSFSRSHAQLSYDDNTGYPTSGNSFSHNHAHNHAHSPIEPIDEQAALEAMLAELTGPTPAERRSLTRTNSTRAKKYKTGPQRAVNNGRVPEIGRGTTLDRKIVMTMPPSSAPPSSKRFVNVPI